MHIVFERLDTRGRAAALSLITFYQKTLSPTTGLPSVRLK